MNTKQYSFSIPCHHEATGKPYVDGEFTDNHYPLSREEVYNLLDLGKKSEDYNERLAVIIRLRQGIPEYTCPSRSTGPSAEKESALGILYYKWMKSDYQLYAVEDMTSEVCKILEIN